MDIKGDFAPREDICGLTFAKAMSGNSNRYAKPHFNFIHHHMGIEMLQIWIIHEVLFRKFLKVAHIPCVYDKHKIVSTRYVITLCNLNARFHGIFELINCFGTTFMQYYIYYTSDSYTRGFWRNDRNICFNNFFATQLGQSSLNCTLTQVNCNTQLFCGQPVVLLKQPKYLLIALIYCMHNFCVAAVKINDNALV
jgi:hypothetical protein